MHAYACIMSGPWSSALASSFIPKAVNAAELSRNETPVHTKERHSNEARPEYLRSMQMCTQWCVVSSFSLLQEGQAVPAAHPLSSSGKTQIPI
ncbi:hypothetical protein C8Q78DRAFT_1059088 [Trametes maxima]|nr:hypothetical protein C8Q78DRAFT_1059088 [Trametes maxima]